MAFLKKLFSGSGTDPREAMRPLYNSVVSMGRDPKWYTHYHVPDNIDGRFEMIAAMLSLTLLRLEEEGGQYAQESVWLTELFVDDMDGQLREIGLGDLIVGKHIGQMMSAVGGRLGAYRKGFADSDEMAGAVTRNIFRSEAPSAQAAPLLAQAIAEEMQQLRALPANSILSKGLSHA